MTKPPSLKTETPGPGTYTPMAQAACLSNKRRVASTVFGVEPRGSQASVDSVHCFAGRVRWIAPPSLPPRAAWTRLPTPPRASLFLFLPLAFPLSLSLSLP